MDIRLCWWVRYCSLHGVTVAGVPSAHGNLQVSETFLRTSLIWGCWLPLSSCILSFISSTPGLAGTPLCIVAWTLCQQEEEVIIRLGCWLLTSKESLSYCTAPSTLHTAVSHPVPISRLSQASWSEF